VSSSRLHHSGIEGGAQKTRQPHGEEGVVVEKEARLEGEEKLNNEIGWELKTSWGLDEEEYTVTRT